jgi:excisionase family DNA binding protein
LPHLEQEQQGRARAHSAYTVSSLAAELGVSAKAVRCAIARHELEAVKRGSRWIISADAVSEWATAPGGQHATGRRRPAPLPAAPRAAGPSLRSVLCGESQAARHVVRGNSR